MQLLVSSQFDDGTAKPFSTLQQNPAAFTPNPLEDLQRAVSIAGARQYHQVTAAHTIIVLYEPHIILVQFVTILVIVNRSPVNSGQKSVPRITFKMHEKIVPCYQKDHLADFSAGTAAIQ